MQKGLNRVLLSIALLVGSMLVGILGFMTIEDYGLVNAFFMTVITFSTVGYNEVQPLSEGGRLFTSFYIILNLGIFAYVVSVITTYVFEGELNHYLKKYRMSKELKKIKDHVIVCGFGRNGSKACEELANSNVPFVLIERDEENLESLISEYNVLIGEATQDEVLLNAGIERAKAIITTLPSDADNVFITLTAKELNPNIKIIARASEDNTTNKLRRAGATKVVMPDAVGGIHMAQLITKPYVIEFLDLFTGIGGNQFILEEVPYQELKSKYQDKSIKDLDVRNQTGTTLVGFKDDTKGFIFNPSPDMLIGPDDVMILLGSREDIKKFQDIYTDD